MNVLKKVYLVFSKILENFAALFMAIMVLVVFANVVMRNLFNRGISWGDEIPTLLMVWFSFIGLAVGVVEHVHMSIEIFTMKLSEKALDRLVRFGYLIVGIFGAFMVRYGTRIMGVVSRTTMPATQWPSSVLYIILPVSGVLVVLNSFLVATKLDRKILSALNPGMDKENTDA
ncbi:MAG: TRAP transporter small permease [Spirochaetaceae bacterium]|jgi:TRAP-type C4-dicarboxylate transport system permease small subunit|nr:TRAP transporter small permease [Spirochaetaceae bacterium]